MKKKTRKTSRITKKTPRTRLPKAKRTIKKTPPKKKHALPVEPQRNFNDTKSSWQFPARYGEDRLVLLVRDPWWLYAYWEVSGIPHERTVLRMYLVTDRQVPNCHRFFDIEVGGADNWYVDVGLPDSEWIAEIGTRTPDGKFHAKLRSNRVRTPRYGVSNVVDEEWMLPDDVYWKLFGYSAGIGGPSSFSVKELTERYFKGQGSSEQSSRLVGKR